MTGAGAGRVSLVEMAAVAAVLGAAEGVSALSLGVRWTSINVGPYEPRVDMLEVAVHADSCTDASLLGYLLRLAPEDGDANPYDDTAERVWRGWSGWASAASCDYPVWVRVIGADPVSAEAAVTKVAA